MVRLGRLLDVLHRSEIQEVRRPVELVIETLHGRKYTNEKKQKEEGRRRGGAPKQNDIKRRRLTVHPCILHPRFREHATWNRRGKRLRGGEK